MPVAVVQPESHLTGREVEAIRECLRSITDAERPRLWSSLEALHGAIASRDVGAVDSVISTTPDGPIRRCLLRVATPFMAECRAAVINGQATAIAPSAPRVVRGHARPDFLGMFSGLAGTVAPVDVWSATRTGLYWEKVNADAFYEVATGPRGHEPARLDWRHRPGVILGCSRQWELDDDGGLCGTFDMGSHPAAQHAARLAQSGYLGLSMSVRFRTRWLAHPSPDEWDPNTGVLDECVRDDALVEAVALTPSPTFPTATVTRVW